MSIGILLNNEFHSTIESAVDFPERRQEIVEMEDVKAESISMDLEQFKIDSMKLMNNLHATALKLLTDNETYEEKLTWYRKLDFAKKFLADELDVDQIASMSKALIQGETIEEYAATIVRKSHIMDDLIFYAEGIKRNSKQYIESVATVGEVEAFVQNAHASMKAKMNEFLSLLN